MGHDILLVVAGLLIGAIIGFLVARKVMEKYLQKNPPVNEEMIKAFMRSMGRTPNQKQINQVMKEMNKYNK